MVGRIPSDEEINRVHTNIEYCIQKYMNKKETVSFLDIELKIDPAFTLTVWDKLEKDNPEFFKAYYAKLLVKDQIEKFNNLIWKQVELMRQYQGFVMEMNTPYSDISPGSTQQISTPSSAQSSREYIIQPQQQPQLQSQQQLNMFSDDGSSFPSSLQVPSDWFDHNGEIGGSPNMVS